MKNRVSFRAKLFRFMALAALAAGATVAASQYVSFQGYEVAAECTRSGSATYVDGKPVCDCTQSLNGGTCTCIVKCPSGGVDFDVEAGGGEN
jgi:hypothetical protein